MAMGRRQGWDKRKAGLGWERGGWCRKQPRAQVRLGAPEVPGTCGNLLSL